MLRAPRGTDLGPESLILSGMELSDAEICFSGSTNARVWTVCDAYAWGQAIRHESRTNYVWMTYLLSNLSAQIT